MKKKVYKRASHIRSVLKGVSWRFIATSDTVLIVILVTCLSGNCSLDNAIKIGASELLLKLALYYLHERIWIRYLGAQTTTNKQLLYKTLSWRAIATSTTFIISGFILNAFDEVALYIALAELVTKLMLYYMHERIWLKLPLGRIRRFFFIKR